MQELLFNANRIYKSTLGSIVPRKRLRIPKEFSVRQFLTKIDALETNYVVLRWFEQLPDLDKKEDLDILVDDSNFQEFKSMLKMSRQGVPVDLYSSTGVSGGKYKNLCSYFPEKLANAVLRTRNKRKNLFYVPSDDSYFISLGYHAIYHKGLKSGLPTSSRLKPYANPAHDYTGVLQALATNLSVDIDISLESLQTYIEATGFSPNKADKQALASNNPWLKHQLKEF